MAKIFQIKEIFTKIETTKINAKANDFPTEYSDEYNIPLLTAGVINQGLARFAPKTMCETILSNVISISANGANSGTVFYQPNNFAVLQDAYAIKIIGREIGSIEEGLYLAAVLNKSIRHNHNWSDKAGWNKIKYDYIELPVKESSDTEHQYTVSDIDWDYMQEYIRKLELERIRELELYLKVTGLNSYELTDEEKIAVVKNGKSGGGKASSL